MKKNLLIASITLFSLIIVAGCGGTNGAAQGEADIPPSDTITLLNVSYDPTREFYRDFNAAFSDYWYEQTVKEWKSNNRRRLRQPGTLDY